MKKTILSLIMGTAAVSLLANEEAPDYVPVNAPLPFTPSHHEINPQIRFLKHSEPNYKYDKIIGGVEYKYFQPEGLNFSAFMGYSHTNHKAYFAADWDLSYLFNYSDVINFYPKVGFSNTSHFSSTSLGNDYQIYCSKFNGGFGATYAYDNIVSADFSIHYFKDLTSTVILHKGNDFWGKKYHSPYGLKTVLELKFPNVMSKEIVVGGFYAQTIKKAYKEFGFNTAVAFAF